MDHKITIMIKVDASPKLIEALIIISMILLKYMLT